jgi:hypothetical protein
VTYTEDELLKVKNVGEKALKEIADLLRAQELNFGMRFEEAEGGDLRVAFPGTPPSTRIAVETGEEG